MSRSLVILSVVITLVYALHAENKDPAGKVNPDSVQAANDSELILDVIDIKGEVDQPGVIFMPKRIEPELSDVELERSFEDELKSGTGDVPSPAEAKHHVENVKDVDKIVKRKRQNNSN